MQGDAKQASGTGLNRRDFLKATAAATAAAGLMSAGGTYSAYAQGNATIKIGLIGCGGRGRGAAENALASAKGVELVALADLFPDRLKMAQDIFAQNPNAKIPASQCFTGFDAYQKLLALPDVTYVILATPPAFRPMHILAAAQAGKHVFAEKPCAVDPAGVRKVLEAAELFDQKKLAFVGGTQRRHQRSYLDTIKRIQDGEIGTVMYAEGLWLGGGLWSFPRQPQWSDTEYQLRNWTYYTWLAGDTIVEQAMHQVDVMNWVMGGPPKTAIGIGGRQVRVDPLYGNIFDHFSVEFDYGNGRRAVVMSRQTDETYNRVQEYVIGTKGTAYPENRTLVGEKETKFAGEATNPYEDEHADLIKSIREGKPINEAKRMAESTLTAIIGRMSAYTGQIVQYNFALNKSKLELAPDLDKLQFGPRPFPAVAMPGKDKLV